MDILIKNAYEFLESGDENLKKARFNAAVSDYFKAIVIFSDSLIYEKLKILPKNHNDRFRLLQTYFKEIYSKVSELFETYIRSYNLSSAKKDAEKLKDYAYGFRDFIKNKKDA